MAKVSVEQIKRSVNYQKQMGLILFAGFLILLTLLLRNIAISELWAFGDLVIPPSDLQTFYDKTFHVWQTEGIGSVASPMLNVKIILLFASVLMGSTVATKAILLSTFVISYASCYYLLRKLGILRLLSFTGASLYSINPVTIAAFIGGEISEIITFAIFPILIYIVYKVFTEDSRLIRSLAILTLLIFVFVWNIYVGFWFGTLVIIPLLSVLLIIRKWSSGIRLKGTLIRVSAIFFILMAVFVPTIVLAQAKSSAASNASFLTDAQYTYRSMSIDNVLRMAGNTGSAQENLGYNQTSFFTLLGSVIVFVAIAPLLLFSNRNLSNTTKIFLVGSCISFGLIIALVLLVRSYPGIVDSNLIFASLRNPKKLLFPLVFALTILFTFGVNRIVSRVNRAWIRGSIIGGLFLCILFYNIPAMDGTLGLAKVRTTGYTVDAKYEAIPSLLARIDPEYNSYRTFVFPWQYSTNLRIHSFLTNYFGTHLGAGVDGVNVGEFKTMFKLIGENPASRQSIFTLYNVKYVVIDKNFDVYPSFLTDQLRTEKYLVYSDHESYWVTGDPRYLYEILSADASFVRSYEDTQFAIFTFTGITEPTMLSVVNNDDVENIVSNPSFESDVLGNWHPWRENLVRIYDNDASAGHHSIAIQGVADWWANVHQLVPIEDDGTYQLKLSVLPYNITDMHVKLLWYDQNDNIRDDTAIRTDYITLYKMGMSQGEWNSVEKTYFPPPGARFVDIQLLASRTSSVYQSTLTLYDDISLSKMTSSDSTPVSHFALINPTHWWLNIDSDGTTKISFAQSYDPRWEARVYRDGVLVETVQPTIFANVLNAFDIKTIGNNLDIEILFLPQGSFEISLVILTAVVLLAAGYVLYDMIKYQRKKFIDTARYVVEFCYCLPIIMIQLINAKLRNYRPTATDHLN